MATKIVPHGEPHKDLVEGFNATLREAGSPWGFYVDPVPAWIPKRSDDQRVWREMHLAIENGERCVGAYALKPQAWRIHGEDHMVADWQGPVSLGVINPRYSVLGLRLIRDMLKKQPLLYSWGHGGQDEPIVQLLRNMKWLLHETPFLFRIVKGKNFLLRNGQLRQDPKKAFAQDLLARTGLANLGATALHRALRIKSRKRYGSSAVEVGNFGEWANDLWHEAKDRYDALAVRDMDAMNTLAPAEHRTTEWPTPTRLQVRKDGRVIGWAIVLDRVQEDEPRFGTMHMGMIADYFALPEDAGEVIAAAYQVLEARGVDMVIANQSHPGWVQAFEDNAFIALPGKRLFCASPQLQTALEPIEQTTRGLFLTNYDGHGPML